MAQNDAVDIAFSTFYTMKSIEVVAGVITDGGRILATQRGYGDQKDGWEFREKRPNRRSFANFRKNLMLK